MSATSTHEQASLEFSEREIRNDRIQRRFEEYHRQNPNVYELIVAYARRAKRGGKKEWGIAAIIEIIRWEHFFKAQEEGIKTEGGAEEKFKISNDYRSRYARLIMEQEADLSGFFKTKELRAKIEFDEALSDASARDVAEREVSREALRDMLSLVSVFVPRADITAWGKPAADVAYAWATAAYARASDNAVRVPPFPFWLEQYRVTNPGESVLDAFAAEDDEAAHLMLCIRAARIAQGDECEQCGGFLSPKGAEHRCPMSDDEAALQWLRTRDAGRAKLINDEIHRALLRADAGANRRAVELEVIREKIRKHGAGFINPRREEGASA